MIIPCFKEFIYSIDRWVTPLRNIVPDPDPDPVPDPVPNPVPNPLTKWILVLEEVLEIED